MRRSRLQLCKINIHVRLQPVFCLPSGHFLPSFRTNLLYIFLDISIVHISPVCHLLTYVVILTMPGKEVCQYVMLHIAHFYVSSAWIFSWEFCFKNFLIIVFPKCKTQLFIPYKHVIELLHCIFDLPCFGNGRWLSISVLSFFNLFFFWLQSPYSCFLMFPGKVFFGLLCYSQTLKCLFTLRLHVTYRPMYIITSFLRLVLCRIFVHACVSSLRDVTRVCSFILTVLAYSEICKNYSRWCM